MGLALPNLSPPEVKDVTLSLFGGRKTDIAPSDVPEGLTPDEQDNVFLPGNVQSRPGLDRLFAAGMLTAGTSVLYEKTYVQPNNDPLTLLLTSDGKLWVEDVEHNPLNPTQPFSTTAGLYAQSVTEFGREYIAFSDLLHGQGVPLQFDGTNFDRVTMDGPGAPPQVADYVQEFTIAAAGVPGAQMAANGLSIVRLEQVGFVCYVRIDATGGIAGALEALQIGDPIQIAGVGGGGTGYNGTWTISSIPGIVIGHPTQFDVAFVNVVAGLPLINLPPGTISTTVVLITTTTNDSFTAGESITIAGVAVPGYNGTWVDRLINSTDSFFVVIASTSFGLANSGGGTAELAGSISVGAHQFGVMWLTRQGWISAPSPTSAWIAGGGLKALVSGIPIGPGNVVARVLIFTGAGGDNFFTLPESISLPQVNALPIKVQALVIPDNTSTSFVVDFSDNALFQGIAIDQIGNDLFDQVVLGPVLGFFAYASRLTCWGDYNKIENFLNMGFCGGYSQTIFQPLGWTPLNTGGTLINGGPWAAAMSWQITGDGTANQLGWLEQSAYQDSFGDAIISPATQYSFRLWAKASGPGLNGTFFAVLSSVSTGFNSTAQFAINTLSVAGGFTALVEFSLATPAVIPDDLVFSIYTTNLDNGATVTVSELAFIFTDNPFRDNFSRWSYVNNPEAFAETTGQLGPDDDDSPIQCFSLLRQSSVLGTAEGIHTFSDNDSEPGDWNVNQLTRSLGAISLRAMDTGKFGTGDGAEDWLMVADRKGPYLFAGADFWKISQEISRGTLPISQDPRRTWNDINFAVEQTIVAKNDPSSRRAYFAVPLKGINGGPDATTPNGIFMLDYREMDTATQIAGAPPLHITITGKMRSSDLTRKWSFWNVACNDIEILERPNNEQDLFFAGGAFPGGAPFGNIYSLDPTKLTDDDYGAIPSYYTTYAFTDHEQEQGLQLGADSKLVKMIHAFITGVGYVEITPIVNSLYNFFPTLSPRLLSMDTDGSNFQPYDLEWTNVGLRGQRFFYRISASPLVGATDMQYRIQKFIAHMMKDPVAVYRQSGV